MEFENIAWVKLFWVDISLLTVGPRYQLKKIVDNLFWCLFFSPTKAIAPILLEDMRKVAVERKGETNFFTSQNIKDCMKKVIAVNLHQVSQPPYFFFSLSIGNVVLVDFALLIAR